MPSYETADKLHGRAERIRRIFTELGGSDPDVRQAMLPQLAFTFKQGLDLSRIDRIRSTAFPLLAGTQDQSAIDALNAIETATLSAYFLHDHLAGTHAIEPSQHEGPDLIADFLQKLEGAYRQILKALTRPH